jgi:serine phosphatase RsbU (regulator of sigma subunit)
VLREQPRLSLVTAVCALVATDGDRATVTVASAGHPLPIRRRPGQVPATLGDYGVLLGVEGEDGWTVKMVEIAPGETLLFYTDGVTETPGDDGRFGDARLRDAMARAGESPEELLDEIGRALREFQSGAALDDRAMLALRFVGARRAGNTTGGGTITARR